MQLPSLAKQLNCPQTGVLPMADKCKVCFVCEEEKKDDKPKEEKPPAFLALVIAALLIVLVV